MAALQRLTDPRCRRGVRHPFAAVLALTFLGLLCRQTDFATLARWAKAHWAALRPALGFTRRYSPHATTPTRVTARYSLAEFRDALCFWLAGLPAQRPPRTAAVDGNTGKRGHDADGDPIQVLNVFVHEARSETRAGGAGSKRETRYFATSVDPGWVTPDELLAAARGHWQMENGLHYIKDRWWDEDRRYGTQPRVALGFAVLLNAVVTVPRAAGGPGDERPLRARADALAWDIDQALDLLTGKPL